ncbi:hypothetical protein [Herminiimonas contaminans]|uniref:Phage replication protein O n=1 Tax=Herminiimonas contaminans TaxID=1111140 RepID=A0ABS0ES61_9BURK|nr:hypothetical protein [Herminiimonas contaminans]MBF8177676.1 hypothetical protein [Herminiimonas contaminans]
MARIRSIKPELPQSESMGNISRDARLTFILLWTLSDDEGRLRGNSRMLASLLFPYDDDVPSLIDGWMNELENEGCVTRYKIDGQSFVQIRNWLIHQKIDKPSKSKIPAFVDSSIVLSNPLEVSSEEGIKDQGKDQEGKGTPPAAAPKSSRKSPNTPLPDGFCISESVRKWAAANSIQNLDRHFTSFVTKVQAKGYVYADWDAALRNAISDDWAKLGATASKSAVTDLAAINARNNAEAKRLLGICDDESKVINA